MKSRPFHFALALAIGLAAGIPIAGQRAAAEEAPAKQEEAKEDIRQVGDALKALAEAGDEEALAALKKAKENDGKLALTEDEARKLIKRAKEKGLLKDSKGAGDATPDLNRVGEALQALAKAEDKDALAALNKAKENGGKLELTPAEGLKFVKRAIEQKLIPATAEAKPGGTDMDELKKVGDALKALAEADDADAKAVLQKAKENEGKISLTPEEAMKFIKRAKEKGLLK